MRSLTLIPIVGLPDVRPGDDLSALLIEAISASTSGLEDGDVVAVCQKVVSKAEGRIVNIVESTVSPFARRVAADTGKDARLVEIILRETSRIVRMADGHLICETGPGWICANAGVDESNAVADGSVTLLPLDADGSAERLRDALTQATGANVGTVITDTFGRPWREGLVEVALGVAGIGALLDLRGRSDLSGRPLHHTVVALADEIASAAGLLMQKDSGVAAVLVRGMSWDATHGRGRHLIRPRALDLFK